MSPTKAATPTKPDTPALAALEQIASIVKKTLSAAGAGKGLERSYVRAKELYAERRRRDRVFEGYSDLFLEPAWDIMLDLFVAEHEDRDVTVAVACLAARVSRSTAIRNLTLLEQRGMIVGVSGRNRDPQAVKLTPRAYEQMRSALDTGDT